MKQPHKFKPFTDDSSSLTIKEMTFENHSDHITIYGNQTLYIDQQSLEAAQEIAALYQNIAHQIQQKLSAQSNSTPSETNTETTSSQPVHSRRSNPFLPK